MKHAHLTWVHGIMLLYFAGSENECKPTYLCLEKYTHVQKLGLHESCEVRHVQVVVL